MKCTWLIEAKKVVRKQEEVVVPEHDCDKPAIVDFTIWNKKRGRMRQLLHYPRCKIHATPDAYKTAIVQGFSSVDLEVKDG